MAPTMVKDKTAFKTKKTKKEKSFAGVPKKKRLGRPPKVNKAASRGPKKVLHRALPGLVAPSAASLSWAMALSEVNSVTGMLSKVMANPGDNIAGLSEDKLGIIKGACNIMNAVVQAGTKTLRDLQQTRDGERDNDFGPPQKHSEINQEVQAMHNAEIDDSMVDTETRD